MIQDRSISTPARVRPARGGARAHVVTYDPGAPTRDYWIAFEASFILRLYRLPPAERFLFGDSGTSRKDLERLATSPVLRELSRVARGRREDPASGEPRGQPASKILAAR